mgnify:FL=1
MREVSAYVTQQFNRYVMGVESWIPLTSFIGS